MKNIIVVGYPKSGCTWISRLVAELIGCPVVGLWNSDKGEIAMEGRERVSKFAVYKSHHSFDELGVDPLRSDDRIIYVLRDPRDVAVSGAHHFYFPRFSTLEGLFGFLPKGEKLYRHTFYPMLAPAPYRMTRMTEAIIHGSAQLSESLRLSWQAHRDDYERPGVFRVSYEEMLKEAEQKCREILNYLQIEKTAEEIKEAVRRQSFDVKKAEFLRQGERGRAKFMRVGKSGQWQDKLPQVARQMFDQAGL